MELHHHRLDYRCDERDGPENKLGNTPDSTEKVEIIELIAVSDKEKKKGICSDAQIILKEGSIARLANYKNPETGKLFEFLTNNFRFNASTVAGLYRNPLQGELSIKR